MRATLSTTRRSVWWLPMCIAGSVLWVLAASLNAQSQITVDSTTRYQTMTGWEVTARVWETNKAQDRFDANWEQHSAELFDRLVNELGINRVRIEIKSGTENPVDYWGLFRSGRIGYREYSSHYYDKVNDNNDPHTINPKGIQLSLLDYQVEKILLPMKRLIEANGEKLIVNLCYVDFNRNDKPGSLSHARNPLEYAELIGAAFDRLKQKHGISPDYFELVLEPDNTEDWTGQRIGHVLVAAADTLHRSGHRPLFIGPSTTNAGRTVRYFQDMIQVPGALERLNTISYHRYGGASQSNVEGIALTGRRYGLQTAMLERLGADAKVLLADLKLGDVSSWQQYGIATTSQDKGHFYYLGRTGSDGVTRLELASRSHHLAHFFRYIRAGAVRIEAFSSTRDVDSVAFINPDGSHIVAALVDQDSGFVEIGGLPSGGYGVRFTDSRHLARDLPQITAVTGKALRVPIPTSGAITVYQVSK